MQGNTNSQGLTLVDWLKLANVDIKLANNTDVRAWRENQDPKTYAEKK